MEKLRVAREDATAVLAEVTAGHHWKLCDVWLLARGPRARTRQIGPS